MKLYIKQIYTDSPLRNFSYLIYQEGDGNVFCVDPYHPDQILAATKEIGGKLVTIINTHEHNDHTIGNQELVEKTGAKVWAHPNARGKIAGVDRFLAAGERLFFSGNNYLQVLDTPGHTHAHLCLLAFSEGKPFAVLTGDTLFNAGVGNCRNGGDPAVLYETISTTFADLADDINVYPGHDYWENNLAFTASLTPKRAIVDETLQRYRASMGKGEFLVSTMGLERQGVNLFLTLGAGDVRQALAGKGLRPEGSDREVFLKLRELRDRW